MTETTEIYELKYLVVPDFLYKDDRLSVLQLKIAAFIYTYTGDKFFFSNQKIGEMFKAHEVSVSRAISQLQEFGYIRLNYQVKSDGGKIRFITRLNELVKSDLTRTLSPTGTPTKPKRYDKDNTLKDNNIKTVTPTASLVINNVDKYVDKSKKKGITSLKDILANHKRPEPQPQNRIYTPWQEHALRVAEKLKIKVDPSWFRLFKDCYNNGREGRLEKAYSRTIDAGARDSKKYFFWAVAN
jgi:YHS domain-containing protein